MKKMCTAIDLKKREKKKVCMQTSRLRRKPILVQFDSFFFFLAEKKKPNLTVSNIQWPP